MTRGAMSDKIVHGGLSAALVDHNIAEVSLYNAATGRTQRVAATDLRRFCEDVIRVIERREKEERDLDRLAKRLYESEYGNMSINGQPVQWANLDDNRKEHYRGLARRFRGAK